MKCACAMTTDEMLANNIHGRVGMKAVLVEDCGDRWTVTEYSSDAAGLGSEHVTIQSAEEEVERIMVKMRRSTSPPYDPSKGTIIDDHERVAKELRTPVSDGRQ